MHCKEGKGREALRQKRGGTRRKAGLVQGVRSTGNSENVSKHKVNLFLHVKCL